MYHSIVRSIVKKNFKSLSIGNYEDLLNTVSNDVIHSFLGNRVPLVVSVNPKKR